MVEGLIGKLAISGFSMLFLVVGLHTMNKGRLERAQSRRIAETETTPIRQLQPGTAEVKGTAQPAEDASLLESPITDRTALATYVEVEEWESSGQGGGSWQTKHRAQTAVPMSVADGTGSVQVELPSDGEMNVETEQWEVGSNDEPPTRIKRYLDEEVEVGEASRYDIGPLTIGERRRYSEGFIEPGDDVYVLGTVRETHADWGERNYVIDDPTPSGDFVLSDKSEAELIREGKRAGLVNLGFGGVLVGVGLLGTVLPWVTT